MRRHRVFEQQTVFGFLDGTKLRADKLHVVFLEHAAVSEFDSEVQRRLPTDRRQHGKMPGAPLAASIWASMRMISSR